MNLKLLSRRTDLIFSRFAGEVLDRGNYLVIRTPSNPTYYYGNFLIFEEAPKNGDFAKWSEIFRKEFSYYSKIRHMIFAWDSEAKGDIDEFLEKNFQINENVSLITDTVHRPPKFNEKIQVREIRTPSQWEEVLHLQVDCREPQFEEKSYLEFKKKQMANYRAMSERGMGAWFGAYLGSKLVGDLGVFYEKDLARYQNVGTHPDFRRQGVCSSLVYHTACHAIQAYKVKKLVMEADANYHAAKIYESIGFQPTERTYNLSWWESATR